jgi:hypothetical protein
MTPFFIGVSMKNLLLTLILFSSSLFGKCNPRPEGVYVIKEGQGKVVFKRELNQEIMVNVFLYTNNHLVVTGRSYKGKFEYHNVMSVIYDLGDQWMELLKNSKSGSIKEMQLSDNFQNYYYRIELLSVR